MKKIVLAVFMAAMALSLSAQINFREGGFAEALEAAKSENKLVFMDCYTSWCGPCKLMASKEFVQEKGEGVELRKRYDVNAYPTLLVLNVKGELLCRHAGYLSVDELIDFAENGVKGGGLAGMHKRYAAGERSSEFIGEYLALLDDAAMSGTIRSVADDFLKDKTNVYRIFCGYVTPDYAVFRSVYARKAELVKRYGEKAGLHLERVWEAGARKYLRREAKKIVGYDIAGLETYYALMKECRVPEADGIRAAALVDGTIGTAEWAALLEAMTEYNRFSRMVEDQMFYACNALFYGQGAEGWKNAGERKKFAALLEERVKALKGKEDTSGRTMTVGGKRMPVMEYYCQSYEEMLEKVK